MVLNPRIVVPFAVVRMEMDWEGAWRPGVLMLFFLDHQDRGI